MVLRSLYKIMVPELLINHPKLCLPSAKLLYTGKHKKDFESLQKIKRITTYYSAKPSSFLFSYSYSKLYFDPLNL